MLFSTSHIFKGLKDFREGRLEIKTPQEQTACLAHISILGSSLLPLKVSQKKIGMKTISFQYNLNELQDKESHIRRVFSLFSSSVRLICSGGGDGSGRLPVACLVKGPDVSRCEDVDGSHGATSSAMFEDLFEYDTLWIM